MLASINGWPVPPRKLTTFKIPGTKRKVTLDAVAGPLLVALAADYHATVRPIDVGPVDDGGYVDRDAMGAPGRKSNHASGTAIDLNWTEEGAQGSSWGKKFFAQAKARAAVAALKRRYGACVAWGGDWRARDYMHWEIKPGCSPTDVLALRYKLGIDDKGVRA